MNCRNSLFWYHLLCLQILQKLEKKSCNTNLVIEHCQKSIQHCTNNIGHNYENPKIVSLLSCSWLYDMIKPVHSKQFCNAKIKYSRNKMNKNGVVNSSMLFQTTNLCSDRLACSVNWWLKKSWTAQGDNCCFLKTWKISKRHKHLNCEFNIFYE